MENNKKKLKWKTIKKTKENLCENLKTIENLWKTKKENQIDI